MMQPGQEYTERENVALSLPELTGKLLHDAGYGSMAGKRGGNLGSCPGYPLGRAARSGGSMAYGSMAGIQGPESRIMHSYLSGFFAVVLKGTGYSENSPLGYRPADMELQPLGSCFLNPS